jgi:hypothetical protein
MGPLLVYRIRLILKIILLKKILKTRLYQIMMEVLLYQKQILQIVKLTNQQKMFLILRAKIANYWLRNSLIYQPNWVFCNNIPQSKSRYWRSLRLVRKNHSLSKILAKMKRKMKTTIVTMRRKMRKTQNWKKKRWGVINRISSSHHWQGWYRMQILKCLSILPR